MNAWFAADGLVVPMLGLAAACIAMILVLRNAHLSRGVLIALQLPCALLLLAALLLRDAPVTGSIIVLTAGATAADIAKLSAADESANLGASLPPIIALGDVGVDLDRDLDLDGVEQAPDLATVLRRYPDISHVHVIGQGLAAHDREALGSRELSFAPPAAAAAPAVVVEWEWPKTVNAGAVWRLRGRIRGEVGAIELRDPADGLEASTTPAADGRFELLGIARAAGPVLFSLRLRDGETTLQTLPVPVSALAAKPMRALLLAAVPAPELKHLRRWASDAGVALDSRINLAPGLVQARNLVAIDAAMLDKLDLLIVDERSWPQLSRQVPALREAIGNGLGVLIRITGPLLAAVQADWRALGLDVELASNTPRAINLDDGAALVAGERLHAWPLTLGGSEHVEMLRDSKARPLAIRRPLGLGRIGVLALTDSFRLATRGEQARHATLWSNLFADLARARGEPAQDLPELAVVGQRAVLCGDELLVQLPDALSDELLDQSQLSLLRDPAAAHCAAFWPSIAGWHRLIANSQAQSAAGSAPELVKPAADATDAERFGTEFFVFDPSTIASVLAQQIEVATAARVNRQVPPTRPPSDREPWRRLLWSAWLLLIGTIWWLERRARQTVVPSPSRGLSSNG